jgi:hypothetical protein
MRRKLFGFVAMLSPVPFVSVVVLSLSRSYGQVSFGNSHGLGRIHFDGTGMRYSREVRKSEPGGSWHHLGVDYDVIGIARPISSYPIRSTPSRKFRYFTLSRAALLILTSIVPALWIGFAVYRRRAIAPGACSICGYNLTGNTSGVCPECGTAVAGKLGT